MHTHIYASIKLASFVFHFDFEKVTINTISTVFFGEIYWRAVKAVLARHQLANINRVVLCCKDIDDQFREMIL